MFSKTPFVSFGKSTWVVADTSIDSDIEFVDLVQYFVAFDHYKFVDCSSFLDLENCFEEVDS